MGGYILRDTTLAAIVRDEQENAACGVELWLRSTLPYVERAVVVDSGSVDGTPLLLEKLTGEFQNLEVYQRPFDDFASSRNFSLSKVKTKRALVVDADELLIPEEYMRLNAFVEQNPAKGYNFLFKVICGQEYISDMVFDAQVTRIFDVDGASFVNSGSNGLFEHLGYPAEVRAGFPFVRADVAMIKHFLSGNKAEENKREYWYRRRDIHNTLKLEDIMRYGWKEKNPLRMLYANPESYLKQHYPRLVGSHPHFFLKEKQKKQEEPIPMPLFQ